MPNTMRMDKDVAMEMRDGTLISADIYRPNDRQKHPAILTRFMQKTFGHMSHIDIVNAVDAGYALVSQVVRGRGTSGGEWSGGYSLDVESADGYDSVEWIARQNWCDGNVGMAGYSHGGNFTWLTAIKNPPHLRAIAPWSSSPPGASGGRPLIAGGAIQLINSLLWMTNEGADYVNRLEREGRDVTEMRRSLDWALSHPDEYCNFLPLKDMPLGQFDPIDKMWRFRLYGQIDQQPREESNPYEKVMVPCSHLTGWYDGGGWGPIGSFQNMRSRGGSKLARENQHLVVGPWQHTGFLLPNVGAINFGRNVGGAYGGPPGSSASDQLLNFFDRYVLGKNIKLPSVKYFVMGKNQWQETDTWPPPQAQWQRFYLHSYGKANTSSGNGLLNRTEPTSELADEFIYDPLNPVPTLGGAITSSPPGFGFVAGPLEQCLNEKRSDVLCYTTSELENDIEITGGPLEIHIFATSSAKDTDFTVKLIDVRPDGGSYNVSGGMMRARGLKSGSNLKVINLWEVNEYVIGLGHTSLLFRKGHRIRIDISSSDFPLYDRNMNTGNPIGEDAKGVPAMQTIYHQAGYASYIDLPVIPR